MFMVDCDGLIWFDGEMIFWCDVKVYVLIYILYYGMGVFEGVCVYEIVNGFGIFWLQDYIDCLFCFVYIMNMKILFIKEQVNEVQLVVVCENNLFYVYFCLMVFYGLEGMGLWVINLNVYMIVVVWEWFFYMLLEVKEVGIKVCIFFYICYYVNIMMCKVKVNGNYINFMLVFNEVFFCGVEEVFLLDLEGYVVEGSGENVFVVYKGKLYMSELIFCFDGIICDIVIMLVQELGYEVIEKCIICDEVYVVDEVFFMGIVVEVLLI